MNSSSTNAVPSTSAVPDWAYAVLQCPCTMEPLQMATAELVSKLADLQSAGKLATTIGIGVEHPIAAGLVNQSQTHFHAIRDRIPTLLPSEAIDLATYSLPTNRRRRRGVHSTEHLPDINYGYPTFLETLNASISKRVDPEGTEDLAKASGNEFLRQLRAELGWAKPPAW